MEISWKQVNEALKSGQPILIYSNEEGETALCVAAECLTLESYRLMRQYATGDVAVMLKEDITSKLGMPYISDALNLYATHDPIVENIVKKSHSGPTFDLKDTKTGSADLDKVKGINLFADIIKRNAYDEFFHNFCVPGHIRTYIGKTGLLDERIGHTEMGIFLASHSGLSGVVCLITLKNISTGEPLTKTQAEKFAIENNYIIVYEDDILALFNNSKKQISGVNNQKTEQEVLEMYRRMVLIRAFESKLSELFYAKKIRGSYHLAIGQEATGVALGMALKNTDAVFLSHRGHHVGLGMGIDPELLFRECIGDLQGLNQGKAGPMHFSSKEHGVWLSNGIVAANAGIAAGVAMGFKKEAKQRIAVNVIGEGSTDEGVFHEAMTMASLWNLPLITICENNMYSQTTSFSNHIPVVDLSEKILHSYGIHSEKILNGTDVLHLVDRLKEIVEWVRKNQKPIFVEIMTYRQNGHSMSDTTQSYKEHSLDEQWLAKDPIHLCKQHLEQLNTAPHLLQQIDLDTQNYINKIEHDIFRRD